MNRIPEQIKQANHAGVRTLETVANTAFGAMERLTALNMSTIRSVLAQRELNSRNLLAARDPQALLSLQAKALLEDSRQAMNYSQRAFEISNQTQDEMSRVLEQGFSVPPQKAA